MTTLKTNEVVKGLTKKGFLKCEGDHSHLIYFVDGKKTLIRTKISHGSKSDEINDSLIHLMSTQIKLEKRQFIDFVKCSFSAEDYLKELRRQGVSL
jgi:predicted RNA binding protein YcfA (HicA-like mRNA interferase family)